MRNVFISHSWDYDEEVERLRFLLNAKPYFNVIYSDINKANPINSTNETYIKSVLKAKILSADVVIGIAGIYSSYSEWIQWELQTAKDNNIPIIGVIPHGAERTSQTVTLLADHIVKWNTDSIVTAIRSVC